MSGLRALLVLAAIGAAGAVPTRAAEPETALRIGYLALTGDERHAEKRTYAGITLRPAIAPVEGAQLALRDARVLARALGLSMALVKRDAADADGLVQAAQQLGEQGVRLLLLDAPGGMVAEVARRTRASGMTLFAVSATADALREAACQPHLLLVLPSRSMLTDALAQYAASRRWNRVLVLQGPLPQDARLVATFRRSAERFGLRIADVRRFTQSNDPRERERNNPRLLTEGVEYDLVFVADEEREFGRRIEYRTKLPRPVMGTEGLQASAWHWSWERHGAPDLNQRFEKLAGRRMTGADWASWAAATLILRAVAAARSPDPDRVVKVIRSPDLTFDTYKGTPGSFRAWDNQLRQPILLHSSNSVVARAPLAGFLHPRNYLDTLGADAPESACRPAD